MVAKAGVVTRPRIIAALVILIVLIAGLIIWRVLAATPFVNAEVEKGKATTPAYVVDDAKASDGSAVVFGKSTGCYGKPSAPTNFKATTTTEPSIEMTWTASKAAANCKIDGYRFWRTTGTTPPDATGAPFADNLTYPNYSNTTVDFNKSYSYTLVAFDTAGHVSSPATLTAKTPTESDWAWPVHKADLDSQTAGLAQCWLHYYQPRDSYHAAIDIRVTYKSVYAPHDGLVVGRYSDGYNTLIIRSGHDARAGGGFVYAVFEHMSAISVNDGDTVTKGQKIGTSGEVGAPGAPHLHFGISDSETNFGTYANPWHTANPLDFLPNDYSPALLTNGSYSCKTSTIQGKSDYGLTRYKTNGTFDMYK